MKRSPSDSKLEFLKKYDDLYLEYSRIDKDQVVTELKKAQWISGVAGNKKALFLAHGYMGSPNEMMFIAEPFLKEGWSVITFLIPGHGSSSKVADAFDSLSWRRLMQEQLTLVTESFDEVRAAGFSTGGLLLHDFLMNNPVPQTLKSLHLISPYFKQRIGRAFGFMDGILKKIFNHISVQTTYSLTRFPDLAVMTKDHVSYNKNIPLGTGLEIKKLGLINYHLKRVGPKIQLPVQLFLTENDWTVDTAASKTLVNRNFQNVELVWYAGSEPHHLAAPLVSSVSDSLRESMMEFVRKN